MHSLTRGAGNKACCCSFLVEEMTTFTEKQRDAVITNHAGPLCDGWLQWSEIRWECHKFHSYPVLKKKSLIICLTAPPTVSQGAGMSWWGEYAHSRFFIQENQRSDSGNFSERRDSLNISIQMKHEQSQTHPFRQEGSTTPNLWHSAL